MNKKQNKALESYLSELFTAEEAEQPKNTTTDSNEPKSILLSVDSARLQPGNADPRTPKHLESKKDTQLARDFVTPEETSTSTNIQVDIAQLLAKVPEYSELKTCTFAQLPTTTLMVATPKTKTTAWLKHCLASHAAVLAENQVSQIQSSLVRDAQQDHIGSIDPVYRDQQSQKKCAKEELKNECVYLCDDPIAQTQFQTLLFQIGGLELAIPLAKLGGIYALTDHEVTPLFGKPAWFMGLLKHELGNINVVNTATWLMQDKFTHDEIEDLQLDYVILLEDSRWGLACSRVKDTIFLQHNEVKWNRNPKKRRWLGGLLIKQMCALLDASVLTKELTGLSNEKSDR